MTGPIIASESKNSLETLGNGLPRSLALWEIASVITSGLIAEWAVLVFVGKSKLVMAIPIALAVGLMFFSHRTRGETLREIGLRTDNFLFSCRLLLLPTALAVFLIVSFGWFKNEASFSAPWRWRFAALPLWALFQQYVLNGFINRRAQIALGVGPKSLALVAIAFSILHLPSPMLASLTLIAGATWAYVYQRAPNLYALALSHTIVSLTLALTVSPRWLNGLRVGFKYFG